MRLFAPVMLIVLTAAIAVAADHLPVYPPVPTVAVVKNWADLLAQPVIDLGGGVRMRLGLEAATCAAGSGVLVYCLTEGFTPPQSGSGEDHLGPARVSLTVAGVRNSRELSMWSRQIADDQHRALGLPLYARMITIPKAGTYVVEIESVPANDFTEARLLATATIVGAGEVEHPWGNLGSPSSLVAEMREESADEALVKAIVISCGFTNFFRAIPTWDGLLPLANLPGADRDLIHQLLPTLLPVTPDSRFNLSRHGEVLMLDSEVPMFFCAGCPPFLVRCWINDQPFVPALGSGEMNGGACFQDVHRVALHCELDPVALKARSGDRISAQILYCRGGWNWSGESVKHLAQLETSDTDPDLPAALLSNRLEFTVP